MLQFLRSLLRQSNPSMRTATGLSPDFIRTHPPLRPADIGAGEKGPTLLFPNCSSWMTGLDARLGGDPLKNGGDEASCLMDLSLSPCNTQTRSIFSFLESFWLLTINKIKLILILRGRKRKEPWWESGPEVQTLLEILQSLIGSDC